MLKPNDAVQVTQQPYAGSVGRTTVRYGYVADECETQRTEGPSMHGGGTHIHYFESGWDPLNVADIHETVTVVVVGKFTLPEQVEPEGYGALVKDAANCVFRRELSGHWTTPFNHIEYTWAEVCGGSPVTVLFPGIDLEALENS